MPKRSGTRWYVLRLTGAGLIAFLAGDLQSPARGETALLRAAEREVLRRWPGIDHVRPDELAQRMQGAHIALFDVREEAEFRVSRIPGALRVDPRTSRREFLERHGEALRGKEVVFYCAVGERSSRLADRVAGDLKGLGAASVRNLRGGIFAWHNEARPLVDDSGPTDLVHSYSRSWGRALIRQDKARQAP